MNECYGISLGGDENILRLAVLMVPQYYEDTKKHSIVHFKQLNCLVYEVYSIKLLEFKKKELRWSSK